MKSHVQRELASLYFLKPTILPNFFQMLVIHSSRSLLPLTNFPPRNESTKVSLCEILSPLLIPDHRVPFINFQFGKILPARRIVRPTRNIVQPTKFVSIDFYCGEGRRKQIKQGEISSFLVTTISISRTFPLTYEKHFLPKCRYDVFHVIYVWNISVCSIVCVSFHTKISNRIFVEYRLPDSWRFFLPRINHRSWRDKSFIEKGEGGWLSRRINLQFLFGNRLFEDDEYNFIA